MNLERRSITSKLSLGDPADKGVARIVGHAAVFNSQTVLAVAPDGTEYREVIAPTAFDRAIRDRQDVRALIDHDQSKVIGRTSSGTLTLAVDEVGLVATVVPPDTTYARDLQVSLARGDISGMSFGFTIADGGETFERSTIDGKPYILRTITDLDLSDVSVVTYPAYADTDVSLRSKFASILPAPGVPDRRFQRLRLIQTKAKL